MCFLNISPDPLKVAMYQLRVNIQAMKESCTVISSKTNTSQFLLSDREVNYSAANSLSTRDPQGLIALDKNLAVLMLHSSHVGIILLLKEQCISMKTMQSHGIVIIIKPNVCIILQ